MVADTHYYLSQQIHPVVARLCDPIEGTDAAQIAECLGLDASGYRQQLQKEEEEDCMLSAGQLSAEDRFRDCDRLVYVCPDCGKNIIIDNVFSGIVSLVCYIIQMTAGRLSTCVYLSTGEQSVSSNVQVHKPGVQVPPCGPCGHVDEPAD